MPSGSVCVLCGPAQSPLLNWARDGAGDGKVLPGLATPSIGRPDPRLALVEVSYHGRPIVAGQLTGWGLRWVFPFAGGRLDPAGFSACTRVAAGAPAPAVRTAVLVREPTSTGLERRALDRLAREDGLTAGLQTHSGASVPGLLTMRTELMLAGRLL